MNDPVMIRLRELSWRRPLTEAEHAELRMCLAAHPEAQADWLIEAGLTECLARLPDAPVPTNFTHRVLQAVEREEARRARTHSDNWRWWWRVLAPRAALVALVASTCSFVYHYHQRAELNKERAAVLAAVADVRSVSSTKTLEDFEAIQRLSPMPPPDLKLLALMK